MVLGTGLTIAASQLLSRLLGHTVQDVVAQHGWNLNDGAFRVAVWLKEIMDLHGTKMY